MRALGIAWGLIVVALVVLGVQTCAFRARANEISSRVLAVRAEADGLGTRVDAVRAALDGRAGDLARQTGALADRLDAIANRVRAIGAQLPAGGAVCLERSVDGIAGGTAPHWPYACVVGTGRRVLVVDGTITAHARGGDGATVHVTCDACNAAPGASRVDATWTGLGAIRLHAPVLLRARVLTGDVSVECPSVLERCDAHLALRIQ